MPDKTIPDRIFAEPSQERSFPVTSVAIASAAILILVGFLILFSRRHAVAPNTVLPLAAYAQNLTISDIVMSESTSLSGGKSTYVDGNIANTGPSTVTGITVQTLFRNDVSMPPQVETTPLTLIRTHHPYVDTEPVSADPLGPGAKREFRLIFENIGSNWNQQLPEIHVTGVLSH